MITNKNELRFYIVSDRIMNGFPVKRNLYQILKEAISPKRDILRFLRLMRRIQYYSNQKGAINYIITALTKIRYDKVSQKLGFSIDYSVFGYGLVIPHYGTIVVGGAKQDRKLCRIAYFNMYCRWRKNYWRRTLFEFGFSNCR